MVTGMGDPLSVRLLGPVDVVVGGVAAQVAGLRRTGVLAALALNLGHLVGFRRGYRASWQTALGAVPQDVVEDNTQAWIGDHCMASDQVPGVLFSNRPVRAESPHLWDISATILGEFGVAKAGGMIGQSVF